MTAQPHDPDAQMQASDAEIVAAAARRIADLFFSYIPVWGPELSGDTVKYEDKRSRPINPEHRTTEGLIVQVDYFGLVRSVDTPWGRYAFCGSGACLDAERLRSLADQLQEHLTLRLYDARNPAVYDFALYVVEAVDGVQLPPRATVAETALDPETAQALWSEACAADALSHLPPVTAAPSAALPQQPADGRTGFQKPVPASAHTRAAATPRVQAPTRRASAATPPVTRSA